MRPILYAFAVGLLGVEAFMVLNLPLPWLLGPITAWRYSGRPLSGVQKPYHLQNTRKNKAGRA